ncbi:lipopolysaccharide biosynthesis protein [Streptomyces taklimakanensis]|uniref:lipopolysaccharide biosynthesis protein n=1 Tax=Streptomyces taklimakanensis TaxID=2569853 RepID=UPI00192E35EE|nr:lipopolysaccharide biosynthesis protein [Streptomyces taklimakanensis]
MSKTPAPPPRSEPRPSHLARLRALGRRRPVPLPSWWPPALGVLLGLTGGAAYGLLATPQYTATSYVAVVPGAATDSATALGFAQAYGRVAGGGAVLAEAGSEAGTTVERLRDTVRAATSPDAPMVEITGSAPSPERAADVSNAVADALTRAGNRATTSTGVRLTLFSPAVAPTEPTSPSLPLAAAVGACAGGLTGGLVLLAAPRGRREEPAFPGVPAPAGSAEDTAGTGSTGDPRSAEEAGPEPVPAGRTAPETASVGAPAGASRERDDQRRGGRRSPR